MARLKPDLQYPLRRELQYLVADARRAIARRWKKVALAIYEWIWPS